MRRSLMSTQCRGRVPFQFSGEIRTRLGALNRGILIGFRFLRQANEDFAIKLRVRLPGLPCNYAAVACDLFACKCATGLFQFESKMLIAREALALSETGCGKHLNAMTQCEDPFAGRVKLTNQLQQAFVVSQIFGRSAAENQDSIVIIGIHLIETNIGIKTISRTLDISVPARFEIMHDEVQTAYGRRSNHRVPTGFTESVNRIKSLVRFAAIASYDQNLSHLPDLQFTSEGVSAACPQPRAQPAHSPQGARLVALSRATDQEKPA